MAVCCAHGYEPMDFIKYGGYLVKLRNSGFHMKDCAPRVRQAVS